MKILSLTYKNRNTGWNIQNLTFNGLTLLVGASGVGKTQILRAIMDIANIAKGRSSNGAEWRISFRQDGLSYLWEGAFAAVEDAHPEVLDAPGEAVPVEYERLYRINGKQDLLIDRDRESLRLNGQPTVKLEPEKSAIALLREEPDIAPVSSAFRQIYVVRNVNHGIRISPIRATENTVIRDIDALKRIPNLSAVEQLFLLYKHKLAEFEQIKQRFIAIFPFVKDMKFSIGKMFNNASYPVLQMKEHGVEQWISQSYISSGMFSTLSHLVAMTLAKDGDVILVDEFENSLGVNCIDEVTDMVLDPDVDLQYVITSHHPYIINHIDYQRWKVVVRQGSDVSVHTADDLHIGSHSKHDAYMQLIQSTAFKTGTL